jgi:3-dehydroquinate synthase
MRRIKVAAPGGDYTVSVGEGIARDVLATWVRRRAPSRLHLITDSRVRRHHGAAVVAALEATGCPLSISVVPAGEKSKSAEQVGKLWRRMVQVGMDRDGAVVALGGGVVGDLAGFAAASVLRGIPFVQIPTTLLAMVDASVGGKTGINLPEGKNLVGAFHQPEAVIADLRFLRTLAGRERTAGWAEVIKTAAIRDARLFRLLEKERRALIKGREDLLGRVVARCVAIKAEVVAVDEREGGLRRILNFGHTLAHGLEATQGYGGFLHGEAVSVGMVFAARFGEALGHTEAGTATRLEALLDAYGLPVRARTPSLPALLSAMKRDKKKGPAGVRWVLLNQLGGTLVIDGLPPRRLRSELRLFLDS